MAQHDPLEDTVQRMLDAGESEENIASVIRAQSAPVETPLVSEATPSAYQTRYGPGAPTRNELRSGNMVAGEPLISLGGAIKSLPKLGRGAGRLMSRGLDVLMHPVTGAMVGGLEGAQRGPFSAMRGVVEGAMGGGILRSLRGGRGLAAARAAGTTARTAVARVPGSVAPTAQRLILSPAEIAAQEQVMRLAQAEAARRGMLSAAGQARSVWPK